MGLGLSGIVDIVFPRQENVKFIIFSFNLASTFFIISKSFSFSGILNNIILFILHVYQLIP